MVRAALVLVLLLLLVRPAAAQPRGGTMLGSADPVAADVLTYERLLGPGAAGAAEIAAFMGSHADWPLPASLARRRDLAIVAEADDPAAFAECRPPPPVAQVTLPDALLRCADAASRIGQDAAAADFARRAWITGPPDPAREARIVHSWSRSITRADQLARFDRLAWTDTAAAARQLVRLDAADRPLGTARLALRRDDASAMAVAAALPAAMQSDPALMLERARWLRRAGLDDDALALWEASGTAAERAAPASHRADFWAERNLLARRRLAQGDNAGAYALADGHAQDRPEQIADAEFLAGFIALERLGDRASAARHFHALAAVSRAAITQARAHYWLARATGDAAEDASAARYPMTFYGQLAALRLPDGAATLAARLRTADDPVSADATLAFLGRDLTRAAVYLAARSEPRRAVPFLLRAEETAPDAVDADLDGRLATLLDMPDVAVALARRAGTAGLVPLGFGWPVAADIPADSPVEPALALAIIRQESSFDTATVSPAGARGLMQLMPATAAQTARLISATVSLASLTADPGANIRLGTAYLRTLLDQFGGSVPMAVAAYNAGSRRVADWVATAGDPRAPGVDAVDWIELIPFNETRNYVQRVIENLLVYRARLGGVSSHPLARASP